MGRLWSVSGVCGVCVLLLLLGGASPVQARGIPGCRWVGKTLGAVKARVGQWKERRQTIRRLRAIDPLLVQAFKAQGKAHAPYSHVHVGAAVSVKRGGLLGRLPWLGRRTVKGFNSESQGDLQLCAERSAMAGLPRGQAKKTPVERIAVVGQDNVPTPCGRCLQALCEVGNPKTEVIAANLKGEHRRFTLEQLVPMSFPRAEARKLTPHRPLIARAVRAYRASIKSGVSRYRPAFGTLVQTADGATFGGMVLKTTAATFTPATQTPLDLAAQRDVLRGQRSAVKTVVIAGVGSGSDPGRLPVPSADERQHLVDANPKANVVLYNPHTRAGAVVMAKDLLPHAYVRKEAAGL